MGFRTNEFSWTVVDFLKGLCQESKYLKRSINSAKKSGEISRQNYNKKLIGYSKSVDLCNLLQGSLTIISEQMCMNWIKNISQLI